VTTNRRAELRQGDAAGVPDARKCSIAFLGAPGRLAPPSGLAGLPGVPRGHPGLPSRRPQPTV
jgi:hypothetical protein